MLTDFDRYDLAVRLFEGRRYVEAARALERLLGLDTPDDRTASGDAVDGVPAFGVEEAPAYGVGDAPLLLARAYYHSAQLGRAEATARRLVESNPDDGYAHVLLGRTLERRGRRTEADRHRRLAEALGMETWRAGAAASNDGSADIDDTNGNAGRTTP